MSETMQLTVIPAANLPTILAADDNDILGKLAAELSDFEADVTTVKGRAEIASKAHKVATAKMDLIRLGKSLTEGWRDQTKAVNAECRVIEERMDQLRDQVRAPLDEYQNREKRRVEGHEVAIRDLMQAGAIAGSPSSADIAAMIDTLDELHADRNWEEFDTKARMQRGAARQILREWHQDAKNREDEAEAARIAAEEQVEREREAAVLAQIAREERIAAEAAEVARLATEAKAALKAEEVWQRQQETEARVAAELARVEREKQEAIDKAERERLAAIERERVIRERERLSAEQAEAAKEAAARQAERDKLAAVEAERKRVAAETERQRIEDERRAADKAHRAKINREVMADLVAAMNDSQGGEHSEQVTEDLARTIVVALAKNAVRHTRIQY